MKSIFKPTGEAIDITTVIDVPPHTATFYQTDDENKVPIPAELLTFPPDNELRRYELARDVMRSILHEEIDLAYVKRNYKRIAEVSVQCADALLVELSKSEPQQQP